VRRHLRPNGRSWAPARQRSGPSRAPTPAQTHRVAAAVRARVRSEFSSTTMVEAGLAAYREALAMRKLAQFT
jgi:hypothetical protein